MRARSPWVIPLLALLACRSPRGAAPPPAAAPAPASPAAASAVSDDEDPAALLLYAWNRARGGQPEGAMDLLRRLDAMGWDVPIDPADFPALAQDPEFQRIVAASEARAPRTAPSPVALTVAEPGLVAEGIAVDAAGNAYVSSIARRKLVRVAPDGAARDLAALDLVPLGLEVDEARGLLWAAANPPRAGGARAPGPSMLLAHDLRTGKLERRVFAEGDGHLLNDVVVGADGSLYATDSEPGAVLRAAPGAERLEPLVPPGRYTYPNGLVLAGDALLVAHAFGIDVVPLDGGAPRPLRGPKGFPLGGIDGLSLRGRTLVAVQNGLGRPRIVRLELAEGELRVARAEVLESANPAWHLPTTGDFAPDGRSWLYLANSWVDAFGSPELPEPAQVPTLVPRLPLR